MDAGDRDESLPLASSGHRRATRLQLLLVQTTNFSQPQEAVCMCRFRFTRCSNRDRVAQVQNTCLTQAIYITQFGDETAILLVLWYLRNRHCYLEGHSLFQGLLCAWSSWSKSIQAAPSGTYSRSPTSRICFVALVGDGHAICRCPVCSGNTSSLSSPPPTHIPPRLPPPLPIPAARPVCRGSVVMMPKIPM